MMTEAKTENDWEALYSRGSIYFLVGTLLSSSAALILVLGEPGSQVGVVFLRVAGVLSLCVWFVVAAVELTGEKLETVAWIAVPILVLAFMLLSEYSGIGDGYFIYFMFFVTGFFVFIVFLFREDEVSSISLEDVLAAFLGTWSTLALLVSAILYVPYSHVSQSARQATEPMRILIDLRLIPFVAFLVLCFGASVSRALRQGPIPGLKPLGHWEVSVSRSSLIGSAMVPILSVINMSISVARAFAGQVLQMAWLVAVFFSRVISEAVRFLRGLASQAKILILTLELNFYLLSALSGILLTDLLALGVASYLPKSSWADQVPFLMLFLALALSCMFLLMVVLACFEGLNLRDVLHPVVTGLLWVLLAFWLGGLIVHSINWLFFPVPGFSKPGLFSLVMFVFLSCGLLYALSQTLRGRKGLQVPVSGKSQVG